MKIGGDFEYTEYRKLPEDSLYKYLLRKFLYIQFFFSGRIAIYSLIKNIISKNIKINIVYLPAYLCSSIYFPVKKAIENSGIKIVFYKQNEEFYSDIKNFLDNSIFYILDYFGKIDKTLLSKLIELKEKHSNIILIRDITHSLFNAECNLDADYYVCSLRKWMFLPDGAFASSNLYKIKEPLRINDDNYVQARISASILKKLNIVYDPIVFKNEYYLSIFQFCEKELDKDFGDIKISDFSLSILNKIDYKSLISKRTKNKEYLLDKICKFKKFSVLDNDSSLFVISVLFDNREDRDTFRKKLMNLNIFLPVHWPFEWQKNVDENIYYHNRNISNRILSFVIDQRYGEREMGYIISAIKKMLESRK